MRRAQKASENRRKVAPAGSKVDNGGMQVSHRRRLVLGLVVACAAGVPIGGCRPPAPRRPLLDQDPVFVIPAMRQTAQAQRLRDMPRLIELLNSEDSAIRLHAIQTLKSLTGETFGYQFWDTPAQRRGATHIWPPQGHTSRTAAGPAGKEARSAAVKPPVPLCHAKP